MTRLELDKKLTAERGKTAVLRAELKAGETADRRVSEIVHAVDSFERRLTAQGRRVHQLECDHVRTRTRVYAAHTYGRHVAHLVKVTCLDCGKVLHEEANAIEVTGI